MSNDDSYVQRSPGGSVAFVGPDAIRLARAISLRSAIRLHRQSGLIPTRGMTITVLFKQATQFTMKSYKRGEHQRAIDDLTVWIDAMKSAMPIVEE
jgi:hypothetical protein